MTLWVGVRSVQTGQCKQVNVEAGAWCVPPCLSFYREKEVATSYFYVNAFARELFCHLGELKAKTGKFFTTRPCGQASEIQKQVKHSRSGAATEKADRNGVGHSGHSFRKPCYLLTTDVPSWLSSSFKAMGWLIMQIMFLRWDFFFFFKYWANDRPPPKPCF